MRSPPKEHFSIECFVGLKASGAVDAVKTLEKRLEQAGFSLEVVLSVTAGDDGPTWDEMEVKALLKEANGGGNG